MGLLPFLTLRPCLLTLNPSLRYLPAGAKHFRIVKFELIRLYEIQHDLRQLSYFDVFGRLRLSLQLARVTLSIPMVIDKAMKEEAEGEDYDGDGASSAGPNGFVEDGDGAGPEAGAATRKDRQLVQRGLLGPRVASVLGLVSSGDIRLRQLLASPQGGRLLDSLTFITRTCMTILQAVAILEKGERII